MGKFKWLYENPKMQFLGSFDWKDEFFFQWKEYADERRLFFKSLKNHFNERFSTKYHLIHLPSFLNYTLKVFIIQIDTAFTHFTLINIIS